MFSNHVNKELSAYCNDELSATRSHFVAEHLIECTRCRLEFEQIKLGVRLAERLPKLSAPDSLWQDVENAIDSTQKPARSRRRAILLHWRPQFAAIGISLVVLIGAVLFLLYSRESRPFWEVARVDGTPRIGNSNVDNTRRLAVGEWLETDASSRAQIQVGSIGQVQIDPNTRVRLLQTNPREHRLELTRGKMSAQIWAPPRLFFVDTPSAVAADLGCAYTLEVDDSGAGVLHVTTGWVALELKDRESMVPAGAACATRPGIGPGTPYFDDASEIFRKALAKFDFEPNDQEWSKIPTLDVILGEARKRDTLTLWHLLSRVSGSDRERVYDRLATLAPPPPGVSKIGVLELDQQMLELWKDRLEDSWSNESGLHESSWHKTWTHLWSHALSHIRAFHGMK